VTIDHLLDQRQRRGIARLVAAEIDREKFALLPLDRKPVERLFIDGNQKSFSSRSM
jgi:hypothetical protein